MSPAERSSKPHSAPARTWRMVSVGLRYFVFYKLNSHRKESLGQRLRESCEQLGLVFIKIGQLLSTRYDLLGRKDCEALQGLLDDVQPIPETEINAIFKEDFGCPPEEVFKKFERAPIASASISQVHLAFTKDGEKVAVKIKRPGIDRTIAADLKIFRTLARTAQVCSPFLRRIDLLEVLRQLEEWLRMEIDFVHEKQNLFAVRDFYNNKVSKAGDYGKALIFPKPFPEFCSPRVITMEFLEGVPAKRFKDVVDNPDYDARASLSALVRAVLRVWLEGEGLMFHGDPHPSNIFIMPGGRVGLVDLGLLSQFTPKQLQDTRDLFLAVYAKDLDLSIRYMLQMSDVPYKKYASIIREDVQQYLDESRTAGMAFWFVRLIQICVKNNVPSPYHLAMFGRMQVLLDGLFETVLPGMSTLEILGEELERALRRRIVNNIKELNVSAVAYVLTEKLKKSPEAVAEMLERYMDHPLEFVSDVSKAVQGKI